MREGNFQKALSELGLKLNDKRRMKAIKRLGKSDDKRAVQPLLHLLGSDPNMRIRGAVAKALDGLEWQHSNDRDRTLYAIAKSDWEAVYAIGQAAVPTLIEELGRSDVSTKRDVVIVLGRIGDKRAVAPLLHELSPYECLYVIELAIALGKIGDSQAVTPMLGIFKSSNSRKKLALAISFAMIGNMEAAQPLICALRDEKGDTFLAGTIAIALGIMGYQDAVGLLANILVNEYGLYPQMGSIFGGGYYDHWFHWHMTAMDIWHAGGGDILRNVTSLSSVVMRLFSANDKVFMNLAAAIALGMIHSKEAIEQLIKATNSKNEAIRSCAIISLNMIRDIVNFRTMAITPLDDILKKQKKDVRKMVPALLSRLREQVRLREADKKEPLE